MGRADIFNNMIEQKLLGLHTCYLAKVLSTNGKTAKILPLGKVKAYGEEAKAQSPLTNVPITSSARYKFTLKNLEYERDVDITTSPSAEGCVGSVRLIEDKNRENFAIVEPIAAGDIVVCICADRNITDAKKGINSTPPAGHHSQSDSIIIGIL